MNVENSLDVKSYCSRKLWEILTLEKSNPHTYQQQINITEELIARKHYLVQLEHYMPKLHDLNRPH